MQMQMQEQSPRLELLSESKSAELKFRISNINVSVINSLRRIVLSEIPIIVFKKATIIANTCGLNNEIVNHRLKCIPIHIKNNDFQLNKYMLELKMENETDSTIVVTTQDFKVKEKNSDTYISEIDGNLIFPPCILTGQYIDFVKLKAKHSEQFQNKSIHLTCDFEIGTAKEDGAFNIVSTCSYSNTIDEPAQELKLQQKKQQWKDEGKKENEIEFEVKNWRLLEGKRIFKEDCFDFVIETIGIYSNVELLLMACDIMMKKLDTLEQKNSDSLIKSAYNTMLNSFDITLEGEDYTLGKVIEYYFLKMYYEPGILSFCGFKQLHPHDTYSIIRISYKSAVDIPNVKTDLTNCIKQATDYYKKIHKELLKLVPR